MALTPCVECKEVISSTADTCPRCGFNYKAIREKMSKDVKKKKCPECQRDILADAEKCPFCGISIPAENKVGMGCLVLLFLIIIAIAMHHAQR